MIFSKLVAQYIVKFKIEYLTDEDAIKWIPVLKKNSDSDTAKENLTTTSINGTALNLNQIFKLPSGATIQIRNVREDRLSKRGKHTLKYNLLPSVELQALNNGDNQFEVIKYTVKDADRKTAIGL